MNIIFDGLFDGLLTAIVIVGFCRIGLFVWFCLNPTNEYDGSTPFGDDDE